MDERKTYVSSQYDGTAVIRDRETDEKVGEVSPGLITAAPVMLEALKEAANTLLSLHWDDADFGYDETEPTSWDDPEAYECFIKIRAAVAETEIGAGRDTERVERWQS